MAQTVKFRDMASSVHRRGTAFPLVALVKACGEESLEFWPLQEPSHAGHISFPKSVSMADLEITGMGHDVHLAAINDD